MIEIISLIFKRLAWIDDSKWTFFLLWYISGFEPVKNRFFFWSLWNDSVCCTPSFFPVETKATNNFGGMYRAMVISGCRIQVSMTFLRSGLLLFNISKMDINVLFLGSTFPFGMNSLSFNESFSIDLFKIGTHFMYTFYVGNPQWKYPDNPNAFQGRS